MRRFGIAMGMLAALSVAAVSTTAMALEEQRGPAPLTGVPGGAKAQAQGQSTSDNSEGTEIRIPGLGKLGTLPKMDFGLELLYGAADGRPDSENEPVPTDDQRDLMIHGTVKHRF